MEGQKVFLNGTSIATPLWAAWMALANQKAFGAGVAPVGFANPLLYKIAGEPALYATCFDDITACFNDPTCSNQAFPAVTGYDLATGLGTPTCALMAQLASPTPLVPVSPNPPPPPVTPSSFAGIGPNDMCGMLSGAVECWGSNSSGQDGHTGSQLTPGCVTGLTGVATAVQVVEGDSHSCVLFSDGGVWCWGDNSVGQLGQTGGATPGSSPTPLDAQALDAVDMGNPPTQIAAGGETTCALLSDGSVWCWGGNVHGQLGTGSSNSGPNPPTQVLPLPKASQVAVSPGGAFACALLASGGVDCWGTGYLGDFNFDTNSTPVSAQGLTNATSITLGTSHACAIVPHSTGNNTLYCWGDNRESEIGEGDATMGAFPTVETSPVVATQVSGVNVIAVAAGDNYTCVRTKLQSSGLRSM